MNNPCTGALLETVGDNLLMGTVFTILMCSILGFPTGRDSATFRDKGTEVSSLSRDKGTMGQAGTAKIRDKTGWDSQNPGREAVQKKTEQKRTF